MGFFSRKPKTNSKLTTKTTFSLFGDFDVRFSNFGDDIYKSSIVRACIRPLAEHSGKLNVNAYRDTGTGIVRDSENDRLQRTITQQPNPYMNGRDFLYKLRVLYELNNNAYVFVDKDISGYVRGLYPVPYSAAELIEYQGQLYFRFDFKFGQTLVTEFENVAILRQDYSENLVFGESNRDVLLEPLDLIHKTNEGTKNAIISSSRMRGLLKTTKGMLDTKSLQTIRDNFVKDYISLENESGIAALDSTQEYIPITNSSTILNAAQMKELRENIYRYFGVNDEIIMSRFTSEIWESFYDNKIEPFALTLSLGLTNAVFTEKEKGFGNKIVFSGDRLLYASAQTKLQFVQLVDRGTMTPNELRMILGLSPYPGGDAFQIRKEYMEVNATSRNPDDKETNIDDNKGQDLSEF